MTDRKDKDPQGYRRDAKCILEAKNEGSLRECVEDGGLGFNPPEEPSDGEGDRIRQCNALITVINEEQAKQANASADTAEDLNRLAVALDATAKRIGDVQLKDGKLKSQRDEYKRMCEDLARAARDAATAGDDSAKREGAVKVMQGIGPREDKLVNDINAHCQSGG